MSEVSKSYSHFKIFVIHVTYWVYFFHKVWIRISAMVSSSQHSWSGMRRSLIKSQVDTNFPEVTCRRRNYPNLKKGKKQTKNKHNAFQFWNRQSYTKVFKSFFPFATFFMVILLFISSFKLRIKIQVDNNKLLVVKLYTSI